MNINVLNNELTLSINTQQIYLALSCPMQSPTNQIYVGTIVYHCPCQK